LLGDPAGTPLIDKDKLSFHLMPRREDRGFSRAELESEEGLWYGQVRSFQPFSARDLGRADPAQAGGHDFMKDGLRNYDLLVELSEEIELAHH